MPLYNKQKALSKQERHDFKNLVFWNFLVLEASFCVKIISPGGIKQGCQKYEPWVGSALRSHFSQSTGLLEGLEIQGRSEWGWYLRLNFQVQSPIGNVLSVEG